MHITLVTWNTKKYTEIASVLGSSITLLQENIDLIEPQVLDIWEISAQKAKQAFELLKKPVLVDDSGVFFDAYTHFPGAFTKFAYQQLGFAGLEKLLKENNAGKFVTILSYMDETLDVPMQFVGEIVWELVFDYIHGVSIDHHVPYNNIFRPTGWEKPAVFAYEKRAQDNHRVRAAKKFSSWMMTCR